MAQHVIEDTEAEAKLKTALLDKEAIKQAQLSPHVSDCLHVGEGTVRLAGAREYITSSRAATC